MAEPGSINNLDANVFNILLVEDNPGDARLVQEMLRNDEYHHFHIVLAELLSVALEKFTENKFDAVLLDLSLPDSQGLKTFSSIRAVAANIPVVILSGLGDKGVAIQAVQEGAQDYLVKGEVNDELLSRALHYAIERHRVADLLQQTEDRLEDFLEHTYDLVQNVDIAGRFRYVNRAWLETLGYERKDIPGLSYFDVIHPVSKETSKDIFERALRGESSPLIEVTFITKCGKKIILEGSVYANCENKVLQSTRAILRNITTRHLEEERIKYLAHHDGLTDLPNRRLFNDRLEQIVMRSAFRDHVAAILFLDLDHFKPVNDNYGHHIGDLLLKTVAERLIACVREGDTVARIGGDEFAIILTDVADRNDIPLVAQKIVDAVARSYFLQEHELSVQVSVGISVFPDDGDTVRALLNCADAAMYQVKGAGRNSYLIYSDSDIQQGS